MAKAGIFGNSAVYTPFGGYPDPLGRTQGAAALVGVLNVSAGFHITEACAVRCGYTLLWIDNVALAPTATPKPILVDAISF
jgi:hypothetical protein